MELKKREDKESPGELLIEEHILEKLLRIAKALEIIAEEFILKVANIKTKL